MATTLKSWRVCMSVERVPLAIALSHDAFDLTEDRVSYYDINWTHRNETPPDTKFIWFVNAVDELDAYTRAVEKEKKYRT